MRTNSITVVNHNDTFIYGNRDEPFVYNLAFRVKVGEPNSAQAWVVGDRGVAVNGLGDGETQVLAANQKAAVDFNGVKLLDVGDLLNSSNHMEIVGTWTWAMERDDVTVGPMAETVATVLKNTLNTVLAAGSLPSDATQIVASILGDFGTAFNLIAGALFDSIPGIPDDAVGSRFYIGLGTKGTLGGIIDSTVGNVPFPTVAIPIVSVPPDITGGHIFSLGHDYTFNGEVMEGNGRHDYQVEVKNTGTPNQPPLASFTSSATSGAAPLSVAFDAAASSDSDGTIVAYNWDFGDFTPGAGVAPTHTFTNAGTFPVTLTVLDNRGGTKSTTTIINVGGAPTTYPTGLTKVGAGCCNTYGDFTWNQVPGATAYEISMDAYFGGGCLTDHSSVFTGQVSGGRVQAFGLCLGSHYNVSIRAQANGQWGPWSPSTNIVL
jgi:hypothetical protein